MIPTWMPDSEEFLEKDRWNKNSILVNCILFVLKVIVGLFTMSMAVLSDAIDSGIDVITSAMARYSVKVANEPADERHTYGHGKFENLSGLIQAIIIVIIAVTIIGESLRRIFTGVVLEDIEWGIRIMAISAGAKYILAANMLRVARKHDH